MGKILLFASMVVTGLTAGLGFINKGKLAETREALATTDTTVGKATSDLKKSQAELKTVADSLTTAKAEATQAASQATAAQGELDKAKNEVADLTRQKSEAQTALDQAKADLQAKTDELAAAKTTPGTTPEAASPSAELQAQLAEKEALIANLQGKLDSAQAAVTEFRKKDDDRRFLQLQKGLEGRILAVNPAWNFVVLNLGDKNGVLNNAELLVKRGRQLVGKVRITSVEPSTSIADIVDSSVPQGFTIAPGDQVIYQSSQ